MVDVKFGVTKGEIVESKLVLFEPYQATFPVAQVADNEVVALLQMLGFDVPVGAVTPFIETLTATKLLWQLPLSQRTL